MIILCLLLSLSHGISDKAVRIMLPAREIVLAGPRGTSVFFQAFVLRHPDNRWVQLEAWEGEVRILASGWDIDGDSPQIQPTYKPLTLYLGPGRYTLRALACASVTEKSECGRVRASATMELHVCGEDCSDALHSSGTIYR